MSRLNDPDNFRGRVAYAAKVIARGSAPTRAFDNCFENYDGDEVSVAILRRAARNPKIARNLDRYISRKLAETCAARMADVPTSQLPTLAAATRARRKADADAWLAGHATGAEPIAAPTLLSNAKDRP